MSKSPRRRPPGDLSVGDLAARAGVPVSTLHFYEAEGLIQSWRTPANHRRFDRRELRKITVIRIAQRLGIPLREVAEILAPIPQGGTVSKADWSAASERWRDQLDARIEMLEALRDKLSSCIGCGCLSIEVCPLYNADDKLAEEGPGARLLPQTGPSEEA